MIRRSPFLLTMLLIAISLIGMFGCASSSQSEDELSTAVTFAATPSVDEEALNTWLTDSGLPEDMSFNEAKSAMLVLTALRQEDLFQEIEDKGVDIYADYPYCIPTWSVIVNWAYMSTAGSPEEFDRYFIESVLLTDLLEMTLEDTRHRSKVKWSAEESKEKCHEARWEVTVNKGLGNSE